MFLQHLFCCCSPQNLVGQTASASPLPKLMVPTWPYLNAVLAVRCYFTVVSASFLSSCAIAYIQNPNINSHLSVYLRKCSKMIFSNLVVAEISALANLAPLASCASSVASAVTRNTEKNVSRILVDGLICIAADYKDTVCSESFN